MKAELILLTIGWLSVIVFIAMTIKIYSYVKARRPKMPHFLFINFYIISYVNAYKELTREESGNVGMLYYIWLGSINIALICLLIFLSIGGAW